MKTLVDIVVGRFTMYRLVTLCLAVLALISFAFSVGGQIAYTPVALLACLATLMVVTLISGRLFAALFSTRAHLESSVITALLLFLILQPTTDLTTLGQVAVAALFASASKYLLAVRGRHIFNPAAVGAVWLAGFHFYLAFWWIGSPIMLPFTALLAFVVLYRTRRLPLAAVFVVVSAAILLGRNLSDGAELGAALKFAFGQTPLVFFAGFMLSEPLTLPPLRWQQLSIAVLVAVIFSVPITVGTFLIGPETALIIGNAVAFGFGQRRAIELVLTAKRRLSPSSVEFVFSTAGPLAFKAGQFVELALPHRGSDGRGSRRMFSIASPPGDRTAMRIGLKLPAERTSSFKTALDSIPVGGTLRATGISGDFVLPTDESKPLLLIAGGIGITPFISQLGALRPGHGRDIVLVYAAGDPSDVLYRDELAAAGVRTVVVTKSPAGAGSDATLPAQFESVVADRVDRAVLADAVPDVAGRHVLVSGPPGLVDAMSKATRSLKARSITKDYFNGY